MLPVDTSLIGQRVTFTTRIGVEKGQPPVTGTGTVIEMTDSGALACVRFDRRVGLMIQRWVNTTDCTIVPPKA
jgi:hypothetical protein